MHAGTADGEDSAALGQPPCGNTAVDVLRRQLLRKGLAIRGNRTSKRAATPLFGEDAAGDEERPALAVVVEHTRPEDAAIEARDVGPTILLDLLGALTVVTRQQRRAPVAGRWLGEPRGEIGAAARRDVDERFALDLARTPRHEVDDPAECRQPIQRR